jgi:hypothetical protein
MGAREPRTIAPGNAEAYCCNRSSPRGLHVASFDVRDGQVWPIFLSTKSGEHREHFYRFIIIFSSSLSITQQRRSESNGPTIFFYLQSQVRSENTPIKLQSNNRSRSEIHCTRHRLPRLKLVPSILLYVFIFFLSFTRR